MTDGKWANLGAVTVDGEPTCGAESCDHHTDGRPAPLVCVRRPGHTGTLIAVEMHVASVDGAPLLFDSDCDAHTPDQP